MLVELVYIEHSESLPSTTVDRGIAANWHNLSWASLIETRDLIKQCLAAALNKPEELFETNEVIRSANCNEFAGVTICLNTDTDLDQDTYSLVDAVVAEVSCRIYKHEGNNTSLFVAQCTDQETINLIEKFTEEFLQNHSSSKSRKPVQISTRDSSHLFAGALAKPSTPQPRSISKRIVGRVVYQHTAHRKMGIQPDGSQSPIEVLYDERFHFRKIKDLLGEEMVGTFDICGVETNGKLTFELREIVKVTEIGDTPLLR